MTAGAKVATPEQLSEARRYAEYSDSAAMIPARMVKRAFAHIDALEAREKVLVTALELIDTMGGRGMGGVNCSDHARQALQSYRNMQLAALLSPGEPQS